MVEPNGNEGNHEVLSSHVSVICRQINQPRISQGSPNSEVVQILILQARKTKHAVHHVIEEATYAAALESAGFAGKIEGLSNHTAFPVEPRIKPGPEFMLAVPRTLQS